MTEALAKKCEELAREHNEALKHFGNCSFDQVYKNGFSACHSLMQEEHELKLREVMKSSNDFVKDISERNGGLLVKLSEDAAKPIRQVIGEAIGEASMCWSEAPKGVFESSRALAIVDKILDAFHLQAGMGVTRWVDLCKQNAALEAQLKTAREEIESQKKHYEKMFDQVYSHDACQAKLAQHEASAQILVTAMEKLTLCNWPSDVNHCTGSEIAQTMLRGNCEIATKALAAYQDSKGVK